jgi:hypothetical protein
VAFMVQQACRSRSGRGYLWTQHRSAGERDEESITGHPESLISSAKFLHEVIG